MDKVVGSNPPLFRPIYFLQNTARRFFDSSCTTRADKSIERGTLFRLDISTLVVWSDFKMEKLKNFVFQSFFGTLKNIGTSLEKITNIFIVERREGR